MAIPTALLVKVLGGLGVLATAATVTVVATRPKGGDTQEDPLKALNEKIKSLGIEGCELVNGQLKTQECTLEKAKIEKIKFDGKSGETLSPNNASLTLKIEKGYEDFRDPNQTKDLYFPEGLRFSFTNSSSSDITIGDSPNQITFKSNTTYDYKIKTAENKEDTLAKAIDLSDLVNKVGLSCNSNGDGSDITECSFSSGINVWKNENNYLTGGGTDPTSTQKKIKVAKDSAGYRQGIKFYVEEEITLKTNDTPPKDYPLNKETSYEIDIREATIYSGHTSRKEKKWFLVDKSTEKLNEKIQALGITDCDLGEGESSKTCTLDAEKIKAIKFDGKEEDTSSPDNNASLTLNIERDHLGSEFPLGLRFNFTNSNNSDVTIGSSSITFKAGFTYDYKIKDDNTKLEKAWTITSLGAKVGLTCTDTETECTLKTTGINAWKDKSHYITNGKISDSSKKMEVTKDQKGYLEGFKFTVKDAGDITLTTEIKKAGNDGIDKLTKTNMNYGIDVKDIGGIKTWFLVEKTPA